MTKKNLTEAVNPISTSKFDLTNPKTYLGVALFGVVAGLGAFTTKKVYDWTNKTTKEVQNGNNGVPIIGSM